MQNAGLGSAHARSREVFMSFVCVSDSIQQLGCHSSRLSTSVFLSLQDRKEAQGLPEETEHANVWPFRRTVEGSGERGVAQRLLDLKSHKIPASTCRNGSKIKGTMLVQPYHQVPQRRRRRAQQPRSDDRPRVRATSDGV